MPGSSSVMALHILFRIQLMHVPVWVSVSVSLLDYSRAQGFDFKQAGRGKGVSSLNEQISKQMLLLLVLLLPPFSTSSLTQIQDL